MPWHSAASIVGCRGIHIPPTFIKKYESLLYENSPLPRNVRILCHAQSGSEHEILDGLYPKISQKNQRIILAASKSRGIPYLLVLMFQ